MDFGMTPRGRDYLQRTKAFMSEHIEPVEAAFWEEARAHTANGDWRQWKVPAVLEELKARARAQDLWIRPAAA